MLSHSELKKGIKIILDGQPYEILEARPLKKAQRRVVIQAKIRNLISGSVLNRNFHQGDTFEEAGLEKIKAKFLYSHRERYFFAKEDDPSKRFDLTREQIGQPARFLKPNQIVEGVIFEPRSREISPRGEEKVIHISLPIKIQLKVVESPPGIKGDRSQAGTKTVTLETGAKINAPLFIEEGDVIEVNTETGEYSRRVE